LSALNNRDTLVHYLGKVWLTRPAPFASPDSPRQGINVCVEKGGEFVAIDYLTLAPDGVFRSKETPLGTKDDDSFRQYIEKLAGPGGQSEQELFRQVCDCYTACGDMAAVAQALGLSRERVRRILITMGAYADDLVSQIAWLHDGGRGKTVAEIAGMLKVSQNTVKKNMAYGE
jgi:hypothetical protein